MATDAVGNTSYFVYDEAGRKVGEIDHDGTLTQFIYDRFDRLVKTLRFADRLQTSTLATLVDAQGKPTNVSMATLVSAVPTTVGRASDQIARMVYDAAGRKVYAVDEVGAVTQWFYDGAGRVTDEVGYATTVTIARTVDALAVGDITVTQNAADRRIRHFYDSDGKQLGTLDGAGYLVEYTYNAAGHLTKQIAYANQTSSSLLAHRHARSATPRTGQRNDDRPRAGHRQLFLLRR